MGPPLSAPTEIYKSAQALIEFSLTLRYAADVGALNGMSSVLNTPQDPTMTAQAVWARRSEDFLSYIFYLILFYFSFLKLNKMGTVSHWLFLWSTTLDALRNWCWDFPLVSFVLFQPQTRCQFFSSFCQHCDCFPPMEMQAILFHSFVALASKHQYCISDHFYIIMQLFD